MLKQWINRWRELGASVQVSRCQSQRGAIKSTGKPLTINESTDLDDLEDRNFLALHLNRSGLICLDVESYKGSADRFVEWLERSGIDLDSLFYERSLNKGFHIYFRWNGESRKNLAHRKLDGVIFDVLFMGRAFTTPSQLGERRCQWGSKNPFTINSFDYIPEAPDWLWNFIEQSS